MIFTVFRELVIQPLCPFHPKSRIIQHEERKSDPCLIHGRFFTTKGQINIGTGERSMRNTILRVAVPDWAVELVGADYVRSLGLKVSERGKAPSPD